jgi:hypothetical protein
MDARLGEQSDVVTKAFRTCAPCFAIRSRFGVWRNGGAVFMKLMKS